MCIGNITAYFLYVNAYAVSKAAAFKISDFNGISNLGFVKILDYY